MTVADYDFRSPPPAGLEGKTAQWLREACGIAPRVWPKILTFTAELTVERLASTAAAAGLEAFPPSAVAFRLAVAGNPDFSPLLAVSRPLLLALINGSLGTPPDALPPDRELSTVENSVCNFLVAQLLLDLLTAGWPAADRPKFSIAARGEPRGVSTLPPNDLVLSAVLTLTGPFGAHPIYLLFPRSAPLTDLVKPAIDPVPVKAPPREDMEAIVREMTVDMAIVLGSTQVTMLQLAMLKAGDVVVLGQKVSEPLRAKVAGKDKFSVWPGAVGRRQAIQIDAPIGG